MDNEIKLTLEAEEPKAPSLTLEGAPALTLDPQQQEQQAKPAVLDETVLSPEEQKVVDDVVNGFFILLENQFEVGDSVVLDSVEGTIASVGIRTTQVRGFDGTLNFIPNRNITVVSNKSRGNMRVQIDIPIYTHSDLEGISTIIKQVNAEELANYPAIVGQPSILGPRTNTASQLVFRVNIIVQNGTQEEIYTQFYSLYQEALLEHGIALPTMYTNPVKSK